MILSNAQARTKMKLNIELGAPIDKESKNLGLYLNAEPRLKIAKNTFIGLRLGMVINSQKFENHDISKFKIDEENDNGGFTFVSTIDYYFPKYKIKEKTIRPYMGLGGGTYLVSSYVEVISFTAQDNFEVKVKKQFGVLFRGGIDTRKIRIGIEYNLIQKADIKNTDGMKIGTVNNSYRGLSVGYIFGNSR